MQIIRHKKHVFLVLISLTMMGCGVKGKPMPPSELPPIGQGEPQSSNKKEDKKFNQKR